jgi:hypothetical protein
MCEPMTVNPTGYLGAAVPHPGVSNGEAPQ